MLTSSGPMVLEFNIRFGEPEMQSLVLLFDDKTDFAEVLLACINGTLDQVHIGTVPRFACNVVMTGEGYPDPDLDHGGQDVEMKDTNSGEKFRTTFEWFILSPHLDAVFFHGPNIIKDGKIISRGKKVLTSSVVRDTLREAVDAAYEGVASVPYRGMYYRKDIAVRYVKISST